MLNGEISLEYFVSLVERSSGMERWSLWMEISGRMQISQSFSRQEEQMVPGEFPGSGSTARRSGNYFDLAIEHEKKVARSIMRKSLLCHIETQTEDEDFDEPFLGDPNLKTIMVSKKVRGGGAVHAVPTTPEPGVKDSNQPANTRPMSTKRSTLASRRFTTPATMQISKPDTDEERVYAERRLAALQVLFQISGKDRTGVCGTMVAKMAGVLQAEMCRVLIVDEQAGQEFMQFNEVQELKERVPVSEGVAGHTLKTKTLVHVKDTAECAFFNPDVDLGEDFQSRHLPSSDKPPPILAAPIPNPEGHILGVILLARIGRGFTEAEEQELVWLSVLLGQKLHETYQLENLDSQLALAESISNDAFYLAEHGCEVHDPTFWMKSFRSQIAQVVLVHRREGGIGPKLLYCNCSDITKEEVEMKCFALRGLCKRMIESRMHDPWLVTHAEAEPGMDREVDLGSSEYEGKTSLILVPIIRDPNDPNMPGPVKVPQPAPTAQVDDDWGHDSNSSGNAGSEKAGRRGKAGEDDEDLDEFDESSSVMAIIIVGSTVREYVPAHASMMQVMSLYIRDGLSKVLTSWREDPHEGFNLSYLQSDDLKQPSEHSEDLDKHVQDVDIEIDQSQEDMSPDSSREERPPEQDMLYGYSKSGIAKMLHLDPAPSSTTSTPRR